MRRILHALRRSALRAAGIGAGLAVASVALASPAAAASTSPVVAPSGTTYNDAAVDWWQYVLGQPAATNPLTDTTGANCATGQTGSVFFLAGTVDSRTATRQCTVPAGKPLFFPLLNAFDVHTRHDGLSTPDKVYADFQSYGFRADTLFATVDGVAVTDLDPTTTPYRACAAPVSGCTPSSFSLTFPPDNLYGLDAGTYQPTVQDGYYLMIAPLSPGPHSIKFGGTGNFGGKVRQNNIYQLVVS